MNNTRLYLSRVILLDELQPPENARAPRKKLETIETKVVNGLFIHLMDGDLCSLSCLHTYRITISSDRDTKLRLFENVGGRLFPLDSHRFCLKRRCKYECYYNAKCIVLATTSNCTLEVKLSPRKFRENIEDHFEVSNQSGELVIVPTLSTRQLQSIVLRLQSNALEFPIVSITPSMPRSLPFHNIEYYLNLTSAVTLTSKVDDMYRYSPFSVKAGTGIATELHYSIRMKTAAGDVAAVKICCIESIAHNGYSTLKSASGEDLCNNHIGRVAIGSFSLPGGIVDVGLLISTPYGFRGDLNDDPDKDLITFDAFSLTVI